MTTSTGTAEHDRGRFLSRERPPIAAKGFRLWTLAFVLYLARIGPMLVRPRVDGKP